MTFSTDSAVSAANSTFNAFNVCEGIFWIVLAVVLAYRNRRLGPRIYLPLALVFAAFGVSDFVELWTRSWYKPTWMLAWKSLNGAGIFLCAFYLDSKRSHADPVETAESETDDPGPDGDRTEGGI